MIVTLPFVIATLVAFFAGRRTAAPSVQAPARAAPLEQPRRPRTLAQALATTHPRLEFGVRYRLVGETHAHPIQELQAKAARALESRLARASLHTCDLEDEADAKLYRFGPLGAHSALDVIQQAQAMGGDVYITLAAAFELVAGEKPGAAALLAFSRPDKPAALARMRQFARLPSYVPVTTSAPASATSSTNGVHKPTTDAAASPTSSTGAPPEA